MSRRRIGSSLSPRERLAAMLHGAGFFVHPDSIMVAKGYWRISRSSESLRWECWAVRPGCHGQQHLQSYARITDCVRRGANVSREHGSPWAWWVDAREKDFTPGKAAVRP